MRAYTITSTSGPRPKAWLGVLALVAVCSLLTPSIASAEYSSVNQVSPGYPSPSDESGTSQMGPTEQVSPGYPSPSAITGSPSSEPTLVSSSPGNPDDGFDWLSAAIGSAAAIALVALGGAAFLTVRRRTAVSPSTASTS
jgi:hypothetical protein